MEPPAAASSSLAVAPGLTAKAAPRRSTSASWSGVSTVPAPTIASGTSARTRRIDSRPAVVRSVTSSTRTPPSSRARASGTAVSASSSTITGTTGPERRISSICMVLRRREDRGAGVGGPDVGAEGREQLAADPVVVGVEVGRGGLARRPGGRVDLGLDHAGLGIDADDVAVADPGDRPAVDGLGREVDDGRDLAGGAGHAPVGEQRHLAAAVLEDAQRR